jgi:hypothetical protein
MNIGKAKNTGMDRHGSKSQKDEFNCGIAPRAELHHGAVPGSIGSGLNNFIKLQSHARVVNATFTVMIRQVLLSGSVQPIFAQAPKKPFMHGDQGGNRRGDRLAKTFNGRIYYDKSINRRLFWRSDVPPYCQYTT